MGEQLSVSARIRRHIRHNLWGILAVFIALGGTAAALPGTNSVDSRDIKNRNVRRADLAPGAVDSSRVLDNSLTGADIAVATLGLPKTLPPSGPAGGDLAGAYPNPQVQENGLDLGGDLTGTAADAQVGPEAIGDPEIADRVRQIHIVAQDLYAQTGSITAAATGQVAGKIPSRDFAMGVDRAALAVVPGPDDEVNGGFISATVRWTTSAATGSVQWRLDSQVIQPGDSVTGDLPIAGVAFTSPTSGANKLSQSTALPILSGLPPPNGIVLLRLVRIGSSPSDTLAATAQVVSIDIAYLAQR
jgi:hypothetical protein